MPQKPLFLRHFLITLTKYKTKRLGRRSDICLNDFWSVGVAAPYKIALRFNTTRRERRPRRSEKNGSAWKPTPTKYHLGFNIPRRAGAFSCRISGVSGSPLPTKISFRFYIPRGERLPRRSFLYLFDCIIHPNKH